MASQVSNHWTDMQSQSLITDTDRYLFGEGTNYRAFEKLGAHLVEGGCHFALWAPNARDVSVIGDFNGWDAHANKMRNHDGIWETFIPGIGVGTNYKYRVVHQSGKGVDKADPFAFFTEKPPATASKVWDLGYEWHDSGWMKYREETDFHTRPVSVYEMHLGSWRRVPEDGSRYLTYREMAEPLANYLNEMNFTHVEFMPLMEHPFYGSWGYQTTGYFAPSSRYGTPQDLMYLIDYLHQRGIGVILDWVPSHFPTDEHGLSYFDGTHLFEHADPRQGFHPDWGSYIFNYGRHEVRSFLMSSAMFWLDVYHVDGLRLDAVASMLYLDYSRREGEWIPNKYGGRENLEAIEFLKQFNVAVHGAKKGILTIAEESTAWPMVSRPVYVGGLGFNMKWDMGWMHDTLSYFQKDPIYRQYEHHKLTFRGLYAFTENFMLSLSHDEVVYGKGSMLNKMPGDEWQKFANLRLLYSFMYSQPGKKLVFMGSEFGQWSEWNHESSLDWHVLHTGKHDQLRRFFEDLNRFYRDTPALHQWDFEPKGMDWVNADDAQASVLSYMRRGSGDRDVVLIVCNFTPVVRQNYRVGVPHSGYWREVLNSDATIYGGSGQGNMGGVESSPVHAHGRPHSLNLVLPPLSAVFLTPA